MARDYGPHTPLSLAASQGIIQRLYGSSWYAEYVLYAQLIEVGHQKIAHLGLYQSLFDQIGTSINIAHNGQLFPYKLISYSENLNKISIDIN